jgi:hypothetical protein
MSRKHFHQIEHPSKPPASTHQRVWRSGEADISPSRLEMVDLLKKQIYDQLSCGKVRPW